MNKNNLPILIGIALPILFVIGLFITVNINSNSINPEYNFIYTNENQYAYSYEYKNTYDIKENRLIEKINITPDKVDYYKYAKDYPVLYVYNTKDNTSRVIEPSEAKKLTLMVGPSSPDGYNVVYYYESMGIFDLFGGSRSNNGYFIEKGNSRKNINLSADTYYRGSIKVIGWFK